MNNKDQVPITEPAPLEGVRVLDLCIVLAGPTCGRTLAQYGAEVIKIDPDHRLPQLTPWLDVGRGKRSISLNLNKPGGIEAFLKLADSADVIIEGFRKGVADRLGIGYERLSKRNPSLIYGSINCFGHEGPWQLRPGFEQNAQAATGVQLRNSGIPGDLNNKNVKPRPATFTLNDYGTGISAAFAIMLAILERNKTGIGQKVEAALSYTSSTITGSCNIDYDGFNREEIGGPGARGKDCFNRLYECSDGWIFISASTKLERDNLKANPDFCKAIQSGDIHLIEKIFETKSVSDWEIILNNSGIPAVRNNTALDLHADPYNQENEIVIKTDYEYSSSDIPKDQTNWGNTTWPGNPVSMSGSNLIDVVAPSFGADTHQVLKEIGISDIDISRMVKSGTIPADLPISLI